MTIIGFLRLLRKHLVLLLFTPILMAGVVIYFTKSPNFTYSSETTLYTGLASGSSVEMGKSLNYFATNTDFDNLINVINSRETQQEVAIRLLAQHLMLQKYDPRYISSKSFNYLNKITPVYIRTLVEKSRESGGRSNSATNPVTSLKKTQSPAPTLQHQEFSKHTVKIKETLFSIARLYRIGVDSLRQINGLTGNNIQVGQVLRISKQITTIPAKAMKDSVGPSSQTDSSSTFSFAKLYAATQTSKLLPASIDQSAYEQTVKNLKELVLKSDTNFVSNLLNYEDLHYSISAISSINVQRIGSSDLVKLKYTTDDPGICQQTLILFTELCIKNYKVLKENRSDAIVKYFEYQVNQATQKLQIGEDKLLAFNKDKNIINYYEQSKAIAIAKEALDVDFNNMRIKLAGIEAVIKRLEEKLEIQHKIQLKSAPILEKRDQLSQIDAKISTAETIGYENTSDGKNLHILKATADKLKEEIRKEVGELYHMGNSIEGIPISSLLNEWITNVVNYEDIKAGQGVLAKRIQDFQKQYEIYAPAGANLKRIEREISVSEQEFLELLHGLNLAKLKMQDLELSSNLKAIDQPFYPITPNPTKRKIVVLGAAFFGFLVVFITLLALLYFDETLKNPKKAAKNLNLSPLGVFPKIYLKTEIQNFKSITLRLIEMMVQQFELLKKEKASPNEPFQVLLFSSSNNEGKTVLAQNLASLLKQIDNKVIVIRCIIDISNPKTSLEINPGARITAQTKNRPLKKFSLINWLFGYPDSRVDYQSPFLSEYGSTLSENEYFDCIITEDFLHIKDYKELLIRNNYVLNFQPDYVIIEIPAILYFPYPAGLVSSVDLPVLICRANRVWSQADQGTLESISKVTAQKPLFVLNGVELDVIESILGELPKERNWLRKVVKKIILFDFFATKRL